MENNGSIGWLIGAALVAILLFSFSSQRVIHSHLPHPLNVALDYINPFNNRTVHITGWGTGDIIENQFDLFVGDGDFGAMKIGNDVEIARLDGVGAIGNLNLSNILVIRHFEDVDKNNISFLFTSQNLVRLAIPIAGADFATYNPRSQMIGGDLGQQNDNDMIRCSEQGYTFIDCDTNLTGADLGVQDDVEIRGDLFASVPYGEMWFHNDTDEGATTIILASDTWTNVSGFNQTDEANQTLNNFNFVNGNALVPDFDGVYHVGYSFSFQKMTASGSNQEFQVIIFVNAEPQDNTETHRTIQRNIDVAHVGGTGVLTLSAGDAVYLSVLGVGNSIDLGVHAANVNLFRIGN